MISVLLELFGVGRGIMRFNCSCCNVWNFKQESHSPQNSLEPDLQLINCANLRPRPSLPDPTGPENKYALPIFFDLDILDNLSQVWAWASIKSLTR